MRKIVAKNRRRRRTTTWRRRTSDDVLNWQDILIRLRPVHDRRRGEMIPRRA
jgi:sucrose-6-phosphate hydrolase SacC (GH32 family)